MKIKLLALALSLTLLFAFTACDSSSTNDENNNSNNNSTPPVHTHSFEDGYCNCGEVSISSANLNGKSYSYAYFKMSWSSSATEQEKEHLRTQYNEQNDEELFEKIESEYRLLTTMFGGFMIDKYVFNENEVSIYKGGKLYKTVSYDVNNNNIRINDELFFYGNNVIYSTVDSQDLKGISIKTVFSKD